MGIWFVMNSGNDKIKVLFVCTGNACRSQMAEGWARHLKSYAIDAYSAGIRPIGVSLARRFSTRGRRLRSLNCADVALPLKAAGEVAVKQAD